MVTRTEVAEPTTEPAVARSPRQPRTFDPQVASDPRPFVPKTGIESALGLAGRSATDQPDLLLRLPPPLLRPSLVLGIQQVKGNHHVARMLGQRQPDNRSPTTTHVARPIPAPGSNRSDGESRAPRRAHLLQSGLDRRVSGLSARGQPRVIIARSETTPDAPVGEAPPAATATIPAPGVMDQARAQEVLTKSYGSIKEIVQGKLVLLADKEATWAKLDEVNLGVPNHHNGDQPWAAGDAKKYAPDLAGFESNGTIYINAQQEFTTLTPHEMLHFNRADGFLDAVGRSINEGVTEYLAMKAVMAANIPLVGMTAYEDEVQLVTQLARLVGEDTLINAFFRRPEDLIEKIDALKGAGTFAELRTIAEEQSCFEASLFLDAPPAPAAPAEPPVPAEPVPQP